MSLEALVNPFFTDLSRAETSLLRLAPLGEMVVCGPTDEDADPRNDPDGALAWGSDRVIRSGLIRWLLACADARLLIDPKGILIHGARIDGVLDLSNVCLPLGLGIWHSHLPEGLMMFSADIRELDLQGTWVGSLYADRARVQGRVFLRNGFRSFGEVRFSGAQIGGDVDCMRAKFCNRFVPDASAGGVAINADGIDVRGDVLLSSGFSAEGEVRLIGARIGGDIDCRGGTFFGTQWKVGIDAHALSADRAVVKGSVFLSDKFKTVGSVRFWGAQIGGKLDCSNSVFDGSLSARRAEIRGDFCWTSVSTTSNTRLDLLSAKVGSLSDDKDSWPTQDKLLLDGFVYERISSGPKGARTRLDWLSLHPEFVPHPYRQMARVMRSEGDDGGARFVLFQMQRRRRAHEDKHWFARRWSDILRFAVGYGYYPGRALWCLTVLTLVGLIVFWCGFVTGSIVPTNDDAYKLFTQKSQLPLHYERFNSLVYSLENSFPVVKLGQAERWESDPNELWRCRPAGKFTALLCSAFSPVTIRWFRWIQVCLGWFFTTMGAAAVTGIVRKD